MDRLISTLKHIEQRNPLINAFVSVAPLEKLKHQVNKRGSLSNWIMGIKDNFSTEHDVTSCSSGILKGYRAPYESTVVSKLRNEGAIVIGKTNMDEFGMGSFTVNTCYGPTINPVDSSTKRVAGGSSGGSAAAVKAGFCRVYHSIYVALWGPILVVPCVCLPHIVVLWDSNHLTVVSQDGD
jgi:aspartyl-tRNA(Asn)/glutamyl-tRNA(Gln) amidotransferase subunit A